MLEEIEGGQRQNIHQDVGRKVEKSLSQLIEKQEKEDGGIAPPVGPGRVGTEEPQKDGGGGPQAEKAQKENVDTVQSRDLRKEKLPGQ